MLDGAAASLQPAAQDLDVARAVGQSAKGRHGDELPNPMPSLAPMAV